ncbi:MAG: hypothetical protein HQL25_07095 [Candidatus Omnitrophica bacterium]|nr:hypothetical protein [Candidatus Omnitrophota bacterium]
MWELFKLVLAIVLMPLVVASIVVFNEHLSILPNGLKNEVALGAFVFIMIFVFLHRLEPIYEFGQNIILKCFQFISPVNKAISCFFPFYTFLICIFYLVMNKFFKIDDYNSIGFYIFGFTLLMHVVITAQQLQNGEKPLWKPNYYFSMAFYFIVLSMVCVLMLDLALLKFSFPAFLKSLFLMSKKYYVLTVKKLLLLH